MNQKKPKDLKPGETCWLERGIFTRRTKAGQIRYGISYSHKGRRYQEIVGSTKSSARHALQIRKAEITQERFKIPTRKKSPSFDEFCQTYLDHARQKKKTWKGDESALNIAKGFFKSKRINEITSWDIERYRASRSKARTKATANRDLALLRYMFNLAVKWGFLEDSPVNGIKKYKEDERVIQVLTLEEEQALYAAAADHLKPIIVTALNTGMRRGELLSLEWQAVDLQRKVITVEYSKSGKVRHIPINDRLLSELKGIQSDHKKGYLFNYNGKRIKDIKTAFLKAVKRSGIRPCRFHDLRHTFATRLVLAGVDITTVNELLGHANISTTMRYAHPTPEHRQAAVGQLMFSVYGVKKIFR